MNEQPSAMPSPSEARTRGRVGEPGAEQVVRALFAAFNAGDVEGALGLLAPDVVWTNVGLPTLRGPAVGRVLRLATRPRSAGFEVVVHRLASEGPVVLTERTDALRVGRVRAQFWVCGTFEVQDGRIVLWRDYVDWLDIAVGGLRGLAGAVVPALGRRPVTAPPR